MRTQASTASASRVLVADAEYGPGLQSVVERVFQTFPRDWQGKTVLVKPNSLAPHPPERAVTTHPDLVRAIVRALRERGAEVVVGDNPGVGGYGLSDRAATCSGITQAAEGCYVPIGQYPVSRPVQSRYMQQVAVSRQVVEADLVVNVPKLKTHVLTVLTAGIKNTFGYVVGGDKMRIHAACPRPSQFAEALVDILTIRVPDLTIMDAVLGMQGNGPSNGSPVHLGKILAGEDVVGLDTVATAFLGHKATDVPHVAAAGHRGLGQTDLDRIEILGEWQPVSDFRFPNTFIPGLAGLVLNRYLSKWINCVPEIISSNCTSCALCISHCPVEAMHMTEDGPQVDRKQCIHCYCCHEMCPAGAVRLSGRMLQWLRSEPKT